MRSSARLFILVVVLALLVIPSCDDEDFAPVSSSLSSRIELKCTPDGTLERSSERLVLSFTIPVDGEYSYSLEDADGLVWEGMLTSDGGIWRSDELAVSSTASMLEGQYSYRIINRAGEVESGSVTYSRQSLPDDIDALSKIHKLTYLDEDGVECTPDSAFSAVFRDSYGNRMVISFDRPSA